MADTVGLTTCGTTFLHACDRAILMSTDCKTETVAAAEASPWHEGEHNLQSLTGMREAMEKRGRVVLRDHMPEQHRAFFGERQQLFLSALDATGQPWATVLEGDVGFITSPSPHMLTVAAMLPPGDPAGEAIRDGAPVGALGIEFETRRRNRLNGIIRKKTDDDRFQIEVVQSFGNCPKYIHARRPVDAKTSAAATGAKSPRRATLLSPIDIALIERADTFFIASRSMAPSLSMAPGSSGSEGLDMSHRGGPTGFVKVDGARRLLFPDYRGNFFFNTLGNLFVEPRCGLLFIDFATGMTLQIAGRGTGVLSPDARNVWAGAERAVAIDIDCVVATEHRSRFDWQFLEAAPQFDEMTKHLAAEPPQSPGQTSGE